MIKSDARLFFPYQEDDDLEDLYDERFFEFKQFFLTKSVVGKVFRAKLEKLRKFETAYSVICEQELDLIEPTNVIFNFSDCVSEAFLSFEQQKGELKRQIGQSKNGKELELEVDQIISLVRAYYQKWNHPISSDYTIDSISKEPDSMAILSAIRRFELNGGKTFSDIVEQKDNRELQIEMKRVSLLLEKFE